MKKNHVLLLFITISFFACENQIKNTEAKVEVEKGTEVIENSNSKKQENNENRDTISNHKANASTDDLLGFWVGDFVPKERDYQKEVNKGESFSWDRTNKICISIDNISDSIIKGHSIVAGNNRPFIGSIKAKKENDGLLYIVEAKEPGDDKHDGIFRFEVNVFELKGSWEAYNKVDIKERKYTLEKKEYKYNPDIMLDSIRRFIDWKKSRQDSTHLIEEEYIAIDYASSTELIHQINASNTLLSVDEVENLTKGDLRIIRNTIYARHGYSFKNRQLRVFFDSQSWYIPVHTDIRKDLTEIEKQNIHLLLKYEKNAEEYYDYFGRG